MTEQLNEGYMNANLEQFVDQLHQNCYGEISSLCVSIRKRMQRFDSVKLIESMSQYAMSCGEIADQLGIYISEREHKYVPYLKELSAKVETKHDCLNCAGGCKANHNMQLFEIKASHADLKTILSKLQLVTLPLYTDSAYPDDYRILRNQMILLEREMTELFFLEETYLIPKILDAQKIINAGGK